MIISDLAYLQDVPEGTSPVGGYKVKRGDTLSELTEFFYANGTPSCYNSIAAINNIADPNLIYVGQDLKFPKYVAGCGKTVLSGPPPSV